MHATRTKARICLALALAAALTSTPAPAAGHPACEVFFAWALDKIVRNPLKYRTTRALETYADELFPGVLTRQLRAATGEYSVADGGGGEGVAAYDIVRTYPGVGRVSVFSIEKPEQLDAEVNGRWLVDARYRHVWGHRIETLSNEVLGEHDLWIDAMGAFAYADRPDLVLATYLRTLKPGGTVLVHAGEARENPSFVSTPSTRMNLLDWLATIENLDVVKIADGSRSVRVRDRARPICIPVLSVRRLSWSRKRPPIRHFVVRAGPCLEVDPR